MFSALIVALAATYPKVLDTTSCWDDLPESSEFEQEEVRDLGDVEGVKVKSVVRSRSSVGGYSFFEQQLSLKGKKSLCFTAIPEINGTPSVFIKGRRITVETHSSSRDGSGEGLHVDVFEIDPKSMTLSQISSKHVDLIEEMNAKFRRALKGTDVDAIVKARDEVVRHYVDDLQTPDQATANIARSKALQRGFELANGARKSGRCAEAKATLLTIVGKYLDVTIRREGRKSDASGSVAEAIESPDPETPFRTDDIQLVNDVAFVLTKCGAPAQGAAILRELLAFAPDRKVAWQNLVEAELARGDRFAAASASLILMKLGGKAFPGLTERDILPECPREAPLSATVEVKDGTKLTVACKPKTGIPVTFVWDVRGRRAQLLVNDAPAMTELCGSSEYDSEASRSTLHTAKGDWNLSPDKEGDLGRRPLEGKTFALCYCLTAATDPLAKRILAIEKGRALPHADCGMK